MRCAPAISRKSPEACARWPAEDSDSTTRRPAACPPANVSGFQALRRVDPGFDQHSSVSLLLQQFGLSLAQGFKERLAVNRLDLPALEVIITGIEHPACLRQFLEVAGHGILQQVVRRPARDRRHLIELRFPLGCEMYFHGSRSEEHTSELQSLRH